MDEPADTRDGILEIWKQFFPDHPVDAASHFFELGGDSLAAINLCLAVERKTGGLVPIGTIYKAPVLRDFSEMVSGFSSETKRHIVTPLRTDGSRLPLFAIAPAVGGVFHYHDFARHLDADRPCFCLEPRISADGGHDYSSVGEIAEWAIKSIKSIQAEGPYHLCGYSFGGTVAWEIAKQLRAEGSTIALLLSFDSMAIGNGFAPIRLENEFLDKLPPHLKRYAHFRDTYKRHSSRFHFGRVLPLLASEIGDRFVDAWKALKKRQAARNGPEDAAVIAVRIQEDLSREYDYGNYDGRLILLRAKTQLAYWRHLDYELGWTHRPLGGLEIIDVPGCHRTLMHGEPAQEVARQTSRILNDLPEQQEVLEEFEDLPASAAGLRSPLDRFREVVASCGERPAMLEDGGGTSYRELDRISDTLAARLLDVLDSEAEGVAVHMTTGPLMCAAFLAVLKTGRYYVPLEPDQPTERTGSVLNNSKASLLISDGPLPTELKKWVDTAGPPVLRITREDLRETLVPRGVQIESSTPAVILYTSGSTGVPKGVLHTHRSVADIGRRRGTAIGLKGSDRYLSIYSGAFMGFLNGFYASIQFGSCFCFYPLRTFGIDVLASWLNANRITVFHSVTSVYRRFVNSLSDTSVLGTIRCVVPGGEPSRMSDVDAFKIHFRKGTVYYSNLGSSEAGSIAFDPIDHDTELNGEIPVGKPFEHLGVTIRDEAGNLCPDGHEGEICLGAGDVFSGYWQDPGKTAEAFSGSSDGSRFFRSGDFGVLLEDGRLVNRGRKDHQIKINGYRIEIPEVESALVGLDEVEEAAVVARIDPAARDDLRLYAFYKLHKAHTDTGKETIRELLLKHLPTPMIPNYLFEVSELPVNPTGKVDRKRLREVPQDEIPAHFG
ncbi:long-chain -fatty-acid--coaligase/synthetase [Haloferula helveola]|uniref:Long-chain -fatty-acid--coaligase/synthetase n=1 Tax=Haloferula helveola TaxID=490095 RepID=A0ABN6H4X2_9BACT|nr:long-chain -fatty-acid--coaligase/synthetase [Haloferula helveola]